jgi:tRNA (guanine37-N1)-methyltransferase
MHFDVLTLFPEMLSGPLNESILKRAQENGLLTVALYNIRDYAADKHHITDDAPYGGGGGMVMKPEPIFAAVEAVLPPPVGEEEVPVILLSPQGRLIGDYVLTGGELAAMVIIDAVTRLLPGVLGDPGATSEDSHAQGLLEGPHYTRPGVFRGWEVPAILCSGNHASVSRWRRERALRRTLERRPDLLKLADLTQQDKDFLAKLTDQASEENG